MFLFLKFPLFFLSNWQFNNIITNSIIYIHIHIFIVTIYKINNFLFNMLNYKIKFYKKIINKSSKSIAFINKSNTKQRVQKGLGKARVGSLKSSMHRGGGVIFGPRPINISLKLNNKEWMVIYKSIFINKRNNIIWFCINKNILTYVQIEFLRILMSHLGILNNNNNNKILLTINRKYINYSAYLNKNFLFKNINLILFSTCRYLIYFI